MKCYNCRTEIEEDCPHSYWILIEWTGNTAIGGHRRSIHQMLCSRTCLGKYLSALSAQETDDRIKQEAAST